MRLPSRIERALEETGLPWSLELGKKHRHLRLAGRMVCVLPLNMDFAGDRRAQHNTVRDIRRAVREMGNG